MNQQRNPFRVNIGFLINQSVGYKRAIPIEVEAFNFDDGLAVEDIQGSIELSRTREGIVALGQIQGKIPAECSRCLSDFILLVKSQFEEFFSFHRKSEAQEDELLIPEDGNIDFLPIFEEYFLLEIPINPVCSADCRGLCAVCGQNLNEELCQHMLSRELDQKHKEKTKS